MEVNIIKKLPHYFIFNKINQTTTSYTSYKKLIKSLNKLITLYNNQNILYIIQNNEANDLFIIPYKKD